MDSIGSGYVYAGDDPVNAVDPSGKLYIQVVYEYVLVGGIRVLIGIYSVYLELTASDLANIAQTAGIIASYVISLVPIPILTQIVQNYVTRMLNTAIGEACPTLFQAYYSFAAGQGWTNCE